MQVAGCADALELQAELWRAGAQGQGKRPLIANSLHNKGQGDL